MVTVDAPPNELPATHAGTRALKRDEYRTAVEMRRFIVRFELGTELVGGSNGMVEVTPADADTIVIK